jgi:hypothetical protein
VPRLKLCGAIASLPTYVLIAWYLVKYMGNFTFTGLVRCETWKCGILENKVAKGGNDRSFIICILHSIIRVAGLEGMRKEHNFGRKTSSQETSWKTGVDGRIILKRLLRNSV